MDMRNTETKTETQTTEKNNGHDNHSDRLHNLLRMDGRSDLPVQLTTDPRNETMNDLTTLARKMMLTPTQAIAIAGVVDHAAQSMGWTRKQMVAECFRNAEACEYLGSVCRRVMS